MKTLPCSLLLAALAASRCSAFDYWPMMAERPRSPEAISAGNASASSLYARHLDAPDSLKSVRGFIATYRTATAEPEGTHGSSFVSGTPIKNWKILVSVANRVPKKATASDLPDGTIIAYAIANEAEGEPLKTVPAPATARRGAVLFNHTASGSRACDPLASTRGPGAPNE